MKKIKKKHYFGITGSTQLREVEEILKIFERYNLSIKSNIMPMLGFLISYKWNKKDLKYPHNKRYPKIYDLFDLLKICGGKCFKTIHYNTKEVKFSGEVIDLLNYSLSNTYVSIPYNKDMDMDLEIKLGSLIDGIQLNIAKPNPFEIAKIKERFPHLLIILQFNNSFNKIPLKELRYMIKYRYYEVIDYILIDFSQGRGIKTQTDEFSNIYKEISKELKQMNKKIHIGFAGGFSSNNIIKRVVNIFNNLTQPVFFSLDVEGRLRDTNNDLDLNEVEQYINNFMDIYNKLIK
jgi:hypothetical protein